MVSFGQLPVAPRSHTWARRARVYLVSGTRLSMVCRAGCAANTAALHDVCPTSLLSFGSAYVCIFYETWEISKFKKTDLPANRSWRKNTIERNLAVEVPPSQGYISPFCRWPLSSTSHEMVPQTSNRSLRDFEATKATKPKVSRNHQNEDLQYHLGLQWSLPETMGFCIVFLYPDKRRPTSQHVLLIHWASTVNAYLEIVPAPRQIVKRSVTRLCHVAQSLVKRPIRLFRYVEDVISPEGLPRPRLVWEHNEATLDLHVRLLNVTSRQDKAIIDFHTWSMQTLFKSEQAWCCSLVSSMCGLVQVCVAPRCKSSWKVKNSFTCEVMRNDETVEAGNSISSI